MKKNNFLLVLLLTVSGYGVLGQTYQSLENRFSREVLTSIDSAAFREQGLQKVRSLFYKADLYQRNTGNVSNQSYIGGSVEDMFYVEEGDSLDLKPMLKAIARIMDSSGKHEPKLKVLPSKTYLASVQTVKTHPQLSYFLILKRVPKQFGSSREMMWQVFLSIPVIKE
ncbi:MAG TPA: hypothetical protein DDW81_03130 [Cryomorphaceae bacterium]|nr:hypothetical protein [Owenweeksia sp.]HBF19062.1 hypothetical protein [Cryomorphaceae bacterium]HCQ15269.1 hypothetical protein [Cryomorphaceae bacterium]|tara:strand:- start:430 stop:933 length:504 start_codon:yes stop_codon:yes gene_type:complete